MITRTDKYNLLTWLLIFSISSFYLVKAVHHHETTHCCEHSCSTEKPSNPIHEKCSICDFSLAPMMGSITFHLNVSNVFVQISRIAEVCTLSSPALRHYFLRGPPVV